MAGDWLKMELNTPEKEEVLAITSRLGWDDTDLTVGKLFRLWRWFDQQTVSGNAPRVTSALLDRIIGVTGFCAAVAEVGWLEITESGVSLPKFDRHNGSTAKSRALTSKRVQKHKGNADGNGQGNAKGNAAGVTSSLPREEKRREEEKSKDAGEPADPIFGTGLALLVRKGVAEKSARGFLGLLRKTVGDDLAVAELLAAAERDDVSDPLAWLRKAADTRKAQAKPRTTGGLFPMASNEPATPRRREFGT